MRRYAFVILFFGVLAAPFLLRAMVVSNRSGSSASPSGTADDEAIPGTAVRLVVITPHNQDIRKEFARAFTRWHAEQHGRPVVLDFRVPGGTNDIKRVLENSFRPYRTQDAAGRDSLPADAYVGVDIVWGGGDYFFDNELKPLGVLQPVRYDTKMFAEAFPVSNLAGVALYDPSTDPSAAADVPRAWVGVCLSSFGIAYNPDLYRSLDLPPPQTWHDLTDPRLNGMLALADPLRSGSASVAFNMVIQRAMADAEPGFPEVDRKRMADLSDRARGGAGAGAPLSEFEKQELAVLRKAYDDVLSRGWKRGMGELLLIAANARYFTDMANNVPLDVGNGQAAAGMCIDFYGRVFEGTVGPDRCKFVSPRGATATTPDPIAILNGVTGERLAVAKRFVEFMLTPEGQQLWIRRAGSPGGPERALRRPPVRRDLYAGDRKDWTDDVNPFAESEGFNSRSEWALTMTETRLVWAAAWMDSRAELKDAYAAILERPAGAARDALLAKLASLPIERRDVEALRAKRKEMEKTDRNAVEEWKARQRIEWAHKFREHYRAVEKAAEE